MKLAILSDIHEDIVNLQRAIRTIKTLGCDVIICLGDITGYSPAFYGHEPNANACIDLIRDKADIVIAGNHDLFTSERLPTYFAQRNIPENWYQLSIEDRIIASDNRIWLYLDEVLPVLSSENLEFLKTLNEWEVLQAEDQKFLFSHFFRPDISGISRWFPAYSIEIRDHFRFMKEQKCSMSFVGHAHPQGITAVNQWFWPNPTQGPLKIKKFHKAIICPAIAGERYPSSFTIFDTEKFTLQIIPNI